MDRYLRSPLLDYMDVTDQTPSAHHQSDILSELHPFCMRRKLLQLVDNNTSIEQQQQHSGKRQANN